MANSGKGETPYVRKVQEDTRHYIQSLLQENETLNTLLAKLENEKSAMVSVHASIMQLGE